MRPLRTIPLLAVLALTLLPAAGAAAAEPPPASTRLVYAPGKIVPIPAAIPHEPGDMIDRRILPDLRWIAKRYPIYVTDGYSGPLPDGEHVGCHGCHVPHSDHYNGLAVDIVPTTPSARCDANWTGITELAEWAEPVQNRPVPPFRWVGYNGDAGHGCGNHLHLSWNHAPARPFQLAEWVEVFPVGTGEGERGPRGGGKANPEGKPRGNKRRKKRVPVRNGPSGGLAEARYGGLSPRGTGD